MNEPEQDVECCSMSNSETSIPSQQDHESPTQHEHESPTQQEHEPATQQEQVIQDNMDKETPTQEPLQPTQETQLSIPNADEELETGPEEYELNETGPEEYEPNETGPEETDDTQPEQVYENDELDAPIAKQESVGDMQVPPPSPNEDIRENETKVRIEDLDHRESEVVMDDTGTETKDDIALVPMEPQEQSTPKPKKKKKIRGPRRINWALPPVYR